MTEPRPIPWFAEWFDHEPVVSGWNEINNVAALGVSIVGTEAADLHIRIARAHKSDVRTLYRRVRSASAGGGLFRLKTED